MITEEAKEFLKGKTIAMPERLKIYTVTKHFFSSIRDFLGEIGDVKLLPQDWEENKEFRADLIVFTGGEDIDPSMYGTSYEIGKKKSHGSTNPRDRWEIHILNSILDGKLPTKKVLGICRGLQLINVGMGGTLISDIWEKFREGHKPIHEIAHKKTNIFSWLTNVNSMHHQGLERYGNDSRKHPINILATESKTGVAEIVLWGNMLLGFQFHPEFFSQENPSKKKISEQLFEWVTGKAEIIPGQSSKRSMWAEEAKKSPEVFYVSTPDQESRIADWSTASTFTTEIEGIHTTFTPTGRIQFDATENNEEEE
jgi:putative glutamine amidotransferase